MPTTKRQGAVKRSPKAAVLDDASGDPTLSRAIQERIGDQLRALYDDLMQQPVPDRFVDLLDRLDAGKGLKER